VNIPVGVAGLALAPILLDESRDLRVRRFDALGAFLVTGGLVALVYGITQANELGWASWQTISLFAGSLVTLAAFAAWELRNAAPLMPFSIFRLRTLTGSNVAAFLMGTMLFSMFLLLTLYMQQVLGYSAMETGLAYLACAGTAIIWANVAAQLVNRVGIKPVMVAGMAIMTVGIGYFTQISPGGSYVGDLLPGLLLIGLGMPLAYVAISIGGFTGVKQQDAGLASGLINTTQQIGGALGIAVLSAIATSITTSAVGDGTSVPQAMTDGFRIAFWAGTGIAALGLLASLVVVKREPAPAHDVAVASAG
jgi:hypothetical protein